MQKPWRADSVSEPRAADASIRSHSLIRQNRVISIGMQAVAIEPGVHVRSLNPNYRHEGVGRVLKVHNEICKVEFNPTVFSRQPHRSINYLLKVPELELCPPPLALTEAGKGKRAEEESAESTEDADE